MSDSTSWSGPPLAWITTAFICSSSGSTEPLQLPCKHIGTSIAALSGDHRVGECHGYRRVHSDRQQRLADLQDVAAIHAFFRAQQEDRAARRALRPRFCPLDDQAA